MEREYAISSSSKITFYIVSAFFFAIALAMFFVARKDTDQTIVYIMGLVFIGLSVLMLTTIAKKKVVINDFSIRLTGTFVNKELQISDIKGYRIMTNKSDKSVVFETNNSAGKFTLSSVTSLTDGDELLNWVQTNFTDLDVVDVQHEKDELLQNALLGATPEEREASLKKAKTITIAYAIGAGIIGFFAIFYDNKIWATLQVIYPFVGALLMLTGRGLIKFMTNRKRSIYPHIFFGLLIISMVAFFKGLVDSELYSAANAWKPVVLLMLIFVGAIFFSAKDKSMPVAGQLLLLVFIAAFYGVGNTLHINNVFDDSAIQTYHVGVADKHISRGKSTTYYLRTAPWGPENKSVNASVGRRMYNQTNAGDTITIQFKPGALNIPFYQLER